jgi:predicted dehydrogenase
MIPMDKLNIGVIGLGWAAQLIHLPLLQKMPEAQVVAVMDRDKAKGRMVADKFGIKRLYTDVNQMLETEDLAAVVVCTSTDAHKDVTLAALRAGKDVLVEKPIARHYSEAVEMADAARTQKRKLMVGMNHRFRPDVMILKSLIEGKELGKIFYVRTGWLRKRSSDSSWFTQKERSGGGVLLDLGIMMLDMAFWMMSYPEVQRVRASHYRQKTREVEDTSLVSLSMKNGSLVNIEVSWTMNLDDDVYICDVFGTEGTATLNPLRIQKELHGTLVNLSPPKMGAPQHLFTRSYENELRHFVGAVRNVHPVISTADESVQRMRIVDAIYKSVRLGKEVAP